MEGGTRRASGQAPINDRPDGGKGGEIQLESDVKTSRFANLTCGDSWNATPCRANEAANWTGFSPPVLAVFARPIRGSAPGTMFARRFGSPRSRRAGCNCCRARFTFFAVVSPPRSSRDEGQIVYFQACLGWFQPSRWYARYLFAGASFRSLLLFALALICAWSRACLRIVGILKFCWRSEKGDLLSRPIVYSGCAKILRLLSNFSPQIYRCVFLFMQVEDKRYLEI